MISDATTERDVRDEQQPPIIEITDERLKTVEDSLAMLVAIVEMEHKKNAKPSGKRVNVSYVILFELDTQLDRVLTAIQVSEALGHRVEVEIDRQGTKTPLAVGLQFFTHVSEQPQT